MYSKITKQQNCFLVTGVDPVYVQRDGITIPDRNIPVRVGGNLSLTAHQDTNSDFVPLCFFTSSPEGLADVKRMSNLRFKTITKCIKLFATTVVNY